MRTLLLAAVALAVGIGAGCQKSGSTVLCGACEVDSDCELSSSPLSVGCVGGLCTLLNCTSAPDSACFDYISGSECSSNGNCACPSPDGGA